MDQDEMSNLYRGPSIDASYQGLFIWPSSFRGEDFLEFDQSETSFNCLWWPLFVNKSSPQNKKNPKRLQSQTI